jgi:hypothetical protein
MTRKAQKQETLKLLDAIRIDFDSRPNAADFIGVTPRAALFFELPLDDAELDALRTILPSVTSLSWSLTDEFYAPILGLPLLGEHMTQITELRFIVDTNEESLPYLARWVPYMKKLNELEMPWVEETQEIVNSAPSTLKRLTIKGETNKAVAELKDALSRMTRLEMLMLPGAFSELIQIINAILENDIRTIETVLDEISDAIPTYLKDFKKVFLYVERGSGIFSPVHFFAELYRFCVHPETIKIFLDRLIQVGINSVSDIDGDTALCNTLAFGRFYPGKIKALIEAGADVWWHHAIVCPSKVPAVGNALHIAATYGSPETTEELLASIDWEYVKSADFEPLRSSTGFTPIHFLSSSAANWPILYHAIHKVYPGILSDISNVCAATPLQSLFLLREKEYVSLESILDTTDFILKIHPAAVDEALPRLFALALDFFAFFANSDPDLIPRIKTLLQIILDALKARLAKEHGGSVPVLNRSLLGSPEDERDPAARSLSIIGAFMFDDTLVDAVTDGENKSVLSTALLFCCGFVTLLPILPRIIDILISKGADINYTFSGLVQGMSPMSIFMANHTPRLFDEEGFFARWGDFWDYLWRFVDRGAVCMSRCEPTTMFPDGGPPSQFVFHSQSVETATKLMKYLLEHNAEDAVLLADAHLDILQQDFTDMRLDSAKAAISLMREHNADLLEEIADQDELEKLWQRRKIT